ncbi:MAG: dihydrodipicolinate synthase family protein [Candidatus Acetothermia bacterium]
MFEGVNVVLTTPFKPDGALDEEALKRKVEYLIGGGIRGSNGVLVPTGSTGECHNLNLEEFKRVWDIVVDVSQGRAKVVVGTNRTSTSEVVELSKYAQKIGADGVMNLAPYYWQPGEKAIVNHYRILNEEVDLPIMVYNNMYVNKVDLPVEILDEVTKFENIKAIKDCTPLLEKMERTIRTIEADVEVINGRGELNEPYGYLMGAKGYVSIIANYDPDLTVELHEMALEEEYKKFVDVKSKKIMPVLDFISTLPPSQEAVAIKYIEYLLGLNENYTVRTPFVSLSDGEKDDLFHILVEAGYKLE